MKRLKIEDVYEHNSDTKIFNKIEQLSHLINKISSPMLFCDRFVTHKNVLFRIDKTTVESNEIHDKYV